MNNICYIEIPIQSRRWFLVQNINMKTVVIIASFFFSYSNLTSQAQAKYDYYWAFGKDQLLGPEFQALEFDFTIEPFEPKIRDSGLDFDRNNASICDANGNLLFYTNGRAVADRMHRTMPNGEDINAGAYLDEFWMNRGYPGRQDITILPDPADDGGYYIIHKPLSYDSISGFGFLEEIWFSYVNMDENDGYGDVIQKNVLFHQDSLLWSYLTVISHANGEDWWIMNPSIINEGNLYFKYLLTENGIEEYPTQSIGPPFHSYGNSSASGDAKFSPDGTKYAFFNHYDGLLLYDFDRETGLLSNIRTIEYTEPDNAEFATCEWSPNSRFLYLAERDTLWQVDTYENDIEETRVFIAEYDGERDPLRTTFFMSALGPDCRIYIRPGSSSNSFHVIHKPDELGIACDFVQQAIKLPSISARGSFPNFPRFRVDEEEKCDPGIVSLFGEDIYWRRDLTTYPNPMTDILYVELPDQTRGHIYVVDMNGQVMKYEEDVLSDTYTMDVSGLPLGMYSVEFVPSDNKERVVYTNKVVKVE